MSGLWRLFVSVCLSSLLMTACGGKSAPNAETSAPEPAPESDPESIGDASAELSTPAEPLFSGASTAAAEAARTGTVNADLLNVRAAAGTNAQVIYTLPRGTRLEILGETALGDSVWYQVQPSDGSQAQAGWAFSRYIDAIGTSPAAGTAARNSQAAAPTSANLTMTCTGTLSNGQTMTVSFTRESGFSQITLGPEGGPSISGTLSLAGKTETQYDVWTGQLGESEVRIDHLSDQAAQPGDALFVAYNQFSGQATCR